jgi:hypothetical protein
MMLFAEPEEAALSGFVQEDRELVFPVQGHILVGRKNG